MKKVIAIVGPTGVGKTDLSIKIAKYYGFEIISGDSVQIYRSLDIGSGKITEEEKQGVKHYLIDEFDINEDYSVADFQKEARNIIDSSNDIKMIVGGTGYYIKSCLYNYEFDSDKRTDEYDDLTNEEIYDRLVSLGAINIPDKNNRRRLLRHLELENKGISPNKKDEQLYDYLIIGLTCDRDKLYERINMRFDKMIELGLIDEVKKFKDNGVRPKPLNSIGYKEIYDYLDGIITLDEAKELAKQHSRNFAKRQMTYFNNQLETKWIDIFKEDAFLKAKELIDEFLK